MWASAKEDASGAMSTATHDFLQQLPLFFIGVVSASRVARTTQHIQFPGRSFWQEHSISAQHPELQSLCEIAVFVWA